MGILLDIAPTAMTTAVLGELRPRRHLRMDIGHDSRDVDVLASVTAIPLVASSVDVLVCYHVLEHVADDSSALREISRVLTGRGVALVQVPIRLGFATDEDPAADEAERVRRFGQADHVRYYGDDFEDRLSSAGLVGSRICPETFVGLRACQTLGLIPNEYVWVVRSATSPCPPLVVPPPTALVRTLDATLDAWGADLAKLNTARARVRRLKARSDRQAARIHRLQTRLGTLSAPRTLVHRVRRRLAGRR